MVDSSRFQGSARFSKLTARQCRHLFDQSDHSTDAENPAVNWDVRSDGCVLFQCWQLYSLRLCLPVAGAHGLHNMLHAAHGLPSTMNSLGCFCIGLKQS